MTRAATGPARSLSALASLLVLASTAPASARAATIGYLASTTYTSGGKNATSFQLAKPAGTLVTDVLVAQLTAKAAAGFTISPPDASWHAVLSTCNGTAPCQFIFFKIATDAEPASYTFTGSAGKVIVAGLAAYRGVSNDASATVNASAAQIQGSVNGVINAPSVTTTVANAMLLAFFAGASNSTIAANSPLTSQYALNSGPANDANGAGHRPVASAGATGAPSAKVTKPGTTKLNASGNGIGQTVALAPSVLDHFVIEAVAGGALPPATQRSPFGVRIRAVDASGNTVTSYGGKVTVTSTGALSTGGGATGTFTNGVLSPWSLTFSGFGSFTLTVSDFALPAIVGSAAVTVNPILDHFSVEASGGGPIPNQTTGSPFAVRITARDSANGVFASFTGTVNVTSTGTLSAGGGTTPSFVAGVSTRSVNVSNAGSWTLTATRTGGTETGTSNAFTVGTVGGFNAFESSLPAGTVAGYIGTKIAGAAFALDLVAVKTASGTVDATFNDSVKAELLGSTRTAIPVGADNCPVNAADYTVVQTVAPAPIANGRSTVAFAAVADVFRESRVRITYPASGPPTTIACSSDVFAVRPDHLIVTVTDGDWQTAGALRTLANAAASGGVVHRAGRPFTVTAIAYSGAATPAITGNYTVNYAPSPTVKSLACQLPAGCANGALATGTWNVTAPGVVQTATASYDEVGTFALALQDLVFAADDVGDPASPAIYPVPQGGGAAVVGRFVPDRFVLAAANTPVFRTFNASDAACATPVPPDTARAFTYIGQPFGYATAPQVRITAVNAAGGTTANYAGSLWKISPTTDVTQTYSNTPIPPDSPPPLTAQLQAPTVTAGGNGQGTVTASSADLLTFTRGAAQGSFLADISLAIDVQDSSESGVSGNGAIASTGAVAFDGTSGEGIDFDSGELFVYGQLFFPPPAPVGPAMAPLAVPIGVEWYDDIDYSPGQFAVVGDDYCTPYGAASVSLAGWTGQLVAGDTSASGGGVMIQGTSDPNAPIVLAAPRSAHSGAVTVTYSAPAWLRNGGSNPSVVATFVPEPNLLMVTSADTPNPAPGQAVTYTVQVSNTGGAATTVVVTSALGAHQAFSLDAFGAGVPFQFVDGSPASGLAPGTASYSSNGGASYVYAPVSGGGGAAAGYDAAVTNWKVPMSGTMNANSGFAIKYRTTVR